MNKSLLVGSLISIFVQMIQYARKSGPFAQMGSKYKKIYLLGSIISTGAIVASYLRHDQDEEHTVIDR